jgi:hypothetical protein
MAKANKNEGKSTFNTFITLGANNHTDTEREKDDFYATPPLAVKELMKLEKFNNNIWEPCCGMNHITNILRDNEYVVRTSDIVDRVNDGGVEIIDFLNCEETWTGDIITNPPYKLATEFVYKSIETIKEGNKVAMFLKLTFLETKKRRLLFDKYPPKTIYVASSRFGCSQTGEFDETGNTGSAVAYCWYIWEKGYTGETILKWFN